VTTKRWLDTPVQVNKTPQVTTKLSLDTLVQVNVAEIFRRLFRQSNFLIIENHPAAILQDMTDVVTSFWRRPHVTNER